LIITKTILQPFFQDDPGELVPEENFWTLWCKGRFKTEADTPTIRLGATPPGLTSSHLHHPPFFTGWIPLLPSYKQCQSTEGNIKLIITYIFIVTSTTRITALYPGDPGEPVPEKHSRDHTLPLWLLYNILN